MNSIEKETLKLQDVIGYTFHDEQLLIEALSHTSYTNERKLNKLKSYQRLEFLGDAVLELFTSRLLFTENPEFSEGMLSKTRASMVCEEALAECAERIGLGDHILLGVGEKMSGGNKKPSILSDVFEALTGAIFIDGGYEKAGDFIRKFVFEVGAYAVTDSKTRLQEAIQKKEHKNGIVYELLESSGPVHQKDYLVRVLIDGVEMGRGNGRSKKEAESRAACAALKQIKVR